MNIRTQFARYVSRNVLGTLGTSVYILADTFFIAQAVGADGITALNLVLPLYSLIFGLGAMLGVGSCIRYTIAKHQGAAQAERYPSEALLWAVLFALPLTLAGLLMPDRILALLGADAQIITVGRAYTRIFLTFTPCFLLNAVCNALTRNAGAPTVAMTAMLVSSGFNILADWVLMFPLGMGMAGAALATALSPVLGVCICLAYLASPRCPMQLRLCLPRVRKLPRICAVGLTAFVGETASGVTTAVFNFIILSLVGNIGVAAYGVVTNAALVAVAMFNGVTQGAQPLISTFFGKGEHDKVKTVLLLGLKTVFALSVLLFGAVLLWASPLTALFNPARDPHMARLAEHGLRLYFIGFLFAGVNLFGTGALSAIEQSGLAFALSLLRGMVGITLCALVMAWLWGMTGVWLSFTAAETITLCALLPALYRHIVRPCKT